MQILQLLCIIVTIAIVYPFSRSEQPSLPAEKLVADNAAHSTASVEPSAPARIESEVAPVEHAAVENAPAEKAATENTATENAAVENAPAENAAVERAPAENAATDNAAVNAAAEPGKNDLSYLAYYAYSEVPPDIKPADTILDSLKDIPIGSPVDEIKLASEAFGLDETFMKTVAKIESDFDPKQRTGSYIGLFQLSHYEFDKYGSGDITNARDNAIAAAYKFATAAILFEIESHKKATRDDLYLIHQQGTQGAAEHVSHPERIAWKSMCATDEGREKGEKWCKRAIWQNTLPAIKQVWKSVDNLPSGAFVEMWRQRIAMLYSRYSETLTAK